MQNSDIRKSNTKIMEIPVSKAMGISLAHDITEIRPGEFKGRAFKKGHVVTEEDIEHLRRLGKENLFILELSEDEIHEDDAAIVLANALSGPGVKPGGPPKEGRVNLIAEKDGLFKVDKDAISMFNMLGDVVCATIHTNTIVKKGQKIAGTRAIPLVMKKRLIEEAVMIGNGLLEVKELKKPKVGVLITGNEIYCGRIKDAFAPVLRKKIGDFGGEILGIHYEPDNVSSIEEKLRELISKGVDLLLVTGGMSVDPDDVTRFAIKRLGAKEIHYGAAVLPGSMILVAYIDASVRTIPLIGIPACGIFHEVTVFDLILPRILAGEYIGRRELADMGHGGLCLHCEKCRYPICPFGK
jgi:molybdenum cofactor synthesis domain-containing protein